MSERIYLDNNGSTQLDLRVSEYLSSILPKLGGNPSSLHSYGRESKALVTKARDTIAAFIGIKPNELVFTSCGTESVNMALRGINPKGHIITSAAEHSCVLAVCKAFEAAGCAVTYLSPGEYGAVNPDAVKAAIRPDTSLIALMAVNNETGVKTDIAAIAKIAEERRIPFFVDAIAQLGKEHVGIPSGVTAMAFSGHKIHALQGVGALYVRTGIKLQPFMVGGEQEHGRRAGTENVIGIVSMGKAVEILAQDPHSIYEQMRQKRDRFEEILNERLPNVVVNGLGSRASNVSNLAFEGVDGESLLMLLDKAGIAASHGSACSSGALEPSRVLLSMGLPLSRVNSSIRFSLSRLTSQQEIEAAADIIVRLVKNQVGG